MDRILLAGVSEIVRSIPVMLGFYPSESLVLVTAVPHDALAAIVDLAAADGPATVRRVLDAARVEHTRPELVAVVVGDDQESHRALITDVVNEARAEGSAVNAAVWVERIAAGQRWHSYLDASSGVLSDPATSPAMAISIAAGQVTKQSRQAVRDGLLPEAPPEVLARRADLVGTLCDELDAAAAESIMRSAIEAAVAGTLPETDREIAELVAALEHPARDLALSALLEDTGPSIALWERVVRGVDGVRQRRPAMVLSVAYHLDGDGVSSGHAADIACKWSPPYETAHMLRDAYRQGIHPTELRSLLAEAAEQ